MSPELFFELKDTKINIELCNIFSIGLINLRMIILIKE